MNSNHGVGLDSIQLKQITYNYSLFEFGIDPCWN